MKHIRLSVLMLTCWLIFIFSTETLLIQVLQLDILQIGFAGLLFTAILLTLVVPHGNPVIEWTALALPVILMLALRAYLGMLHNPSLLVYTIIEVSAMVISVAMTRRIRVALDAFESAVVRMTFGRDDRLPGSEVSGASFLYREVRRARNHQRPIALMAIAVNENGAKPTLEKMVQEVQMAMMKQFSLAGVSKTLCDSLEDCAVIVQEEDHFLVALPEAKPEDVPFIVSRLRKQVADRVGVDLLIGAASLSKDSYTFEGLVAKATDEMKMSAAPAGESHRVVVEKPVTH